ncbi:MULTISPECIES: class F sortase [Amycolatopsis]|uniref:class F sortase n=1 Tax=Amycolatopsis TaxID=1813 RepID=UPI000B8AD8FD|nr:MULTISPECIES: class F sortase [Amycolatopsis]OXM61739.1 class F sortase [Amycolatopsis sp. KNN50.9b]
MIRAALAVALGLLLLSGCAAAPEQAPTASVPAAVEIPAIGARSSLIPLGLNEDGTVEVPPVTSPRQAGWYSLGPAPGERGPAVILGHVDGNRQQGIFSRLHELAPGDRISVSRVDGSRSGFAVTRVERVPKTDFPTAAVYGDTAGPELRLITCGGVFDRAARSYRDNVIVFAVLA